MEELSSDRVVVVLKVFRFVIVMAVAHVVVS